MLAVVGLHGCFEVSKTIVDLLINWHINLGAGCPKHHDACTIVLLLELADVFTKHLNHLPTGLCIFHIIAIETFCVILVERSFHGNYLLQLVANGQNVLLFQHLGIHGCLEGVLGINIPASEHDVVKTGQRYDFIIFQIFLIVALANTNLVVLSH